MGNPAMTLGQRAVDRNNNFNLLRACAASGVILSHAYPLTLGVGTPEPMTQLLGDSLGHVCVLIFFATSGFFITASFERATSLSRFFLARVLRIFPGLFVMSCVVYLFLALLSYAPLTVYLSAVPGRIWDTVSLFGRPTALPGLFQTLPFPRAVNGSLWTLKFEVLCYGAVVVAGLIGIFKSRLLTALSLILIVALRYYVDYANVSTQGVLYYVVNMARLGLPFALGAAAYVYRDQLLLSWKIMAGLWAVTVIIANLQVPHAAFALCFATALTYSTFWFGYLDLAPLRHYNRLGDYSYGIYIYAFPVQQSLIHLGIGTSPLSNTLASLVVTTALAVLSWHYVEQPSLTLRHRWRGKPQAQ